MQWHNLTNSEYIQNACWPLVVVSNSPENQHDFCRLNNVPRKPLCSYIVKDHKGNENNIIVLSDSIAKFDRNTKGKINNSI